MITIIPKEKIRRVDLYVNTGKKSMSRIKRELGCDYIINGGLFHTDTFTPAGYLTSNGKVLEEVANPFGFAINKDKMVFSYGNNVNYPDFLGCYHVLVRDGEIAIAQSESNKYGYTKRTAIGLTRDGSIVLLCDQTNRSLYGIAGELIDAGCDVALNYDGGGSTQAIFDKKRMTSSRIVHNFLCVWTED